MSSVQVNKILTKSRNPKEYGIRLENEIGSVIQNLDDGWSLIKFDKHKIKTKKKENKTTKWILAPLEWYIHQDDLKKII